MRTDSPPSEDVEVQVRVGANQTSSTMGFLRSLRDRASSISPKAYGSNAPSNPITFVAVVLGLILIASYIFWPNSVVPKIAIYDNHEFSRDEATQIRASLVSKNIKAEINDSNCVLIASADLQKALKIVQDLGFQPKSFDTIRKESIEGSNPFEYPENGRKRQKALLAEQAEALLKDSEILDIVSININFSSEPRTRPILGGKPDTAYVKLKTRSNQRLDEDQVAFIVRNLIGMNPEVDPKRITITDGQMHYPHSGDVRELDLRSRIHQSLSQNQYKNIKIQISRSFSKPDAPLDPDAKMVSYQEPIASAPEPLDRVGINQPMKLENPSPPSSSRQVTNSPKNSRPIPTEKPVAYRIKIVAPAKTTIEELEKIRKIVLITLAPEELSEIEVTEVDSKNSVPLSSPEHPALPKLIPPPTIPDSRQPRDSVADNSLKSAAVEPTSSEIDSRE